MVGVGTKHTCLLGKISEITLRTEYCTSSTPATLSLDKLGLHYVIHYINR